MTTGPSSRFASWLFAICAVLAILVFAPARTWAQLPDAGDSYTDKFCYTSGNSCFNRFNYGGAPTLNVANVSGKTFFNQPFTDIENTYIQFSLATLPAGLTGSNISKATLKLFVTGGTAPGAGTFNVFLMDGSWTEGTITYASTGRFPTTLVASGVQVTASMADDYLLVDVTSAVQAWLGGNASAIPAVASAANYGLVLAPASGSTINVSFDSKESATTSHDPEIIVELATTGTPGTAATVQVGTTSTVAYGIPAAVLNSGTPNAAVLNFSIPQGQAGNPGNPGTAATVQVGSTLTLAAGASASVLNSGTPNAAILNFSIPRGADGATGAQGPPVSFQGPWLSTTVYGVGSVVSFNGSSYISLIASNTGNQPVTSTTQWSLLAQQGATGTTGQQGLMGLPGANGQAATVQAGSTTTATPGVPASVVNVGTPSAAIFNFSIPQGIAGTNGTAGTAATIQVGTTATVPAGTSASVSNSGTTNAAVLNFSIPSGTAGTAATVQVGSTSTVAGGTSASVSNSGTSNAAVLNFSIPQGLAGTNGTAGTAATIQVGTTSTVPAGTPATVVNTGTPNAAVLNFSIPQGAPGSGSLSGTANFLPLFTSATAVGNSNVFQSTSGNVGLGTTTPQVALDVNGSVNASTSFNLSGQSFVSAPGGGGENTAVGANALLSLQPSSINGANTAVGYASLALNTGGGNTGIGSFALQTNHTGSGNTAVGYYALQSDGTNNTALGQQAGSLTTGLTNATAIGAYADVEQSNSLVLGSILNTNSCATTYNCGSTKVGIGTTMPAFPLDVAGIIRSSTGGFQFPDGSVQITAASGGGVGGGGGTITGVTAGTGLSGGGTSGVVTLNIASNVCAAGQALSALPFTCSPFATLSANSFSGNQTVSGNISSNGTVSGVTLSGGTVSASTEYDLGGAAIVTSSISNGTLFLGQNAGNAADFTTYNNTATGVFALRNLTGNSTPFQGAGNTAAGESALYDTTTGNNNTALGVSALYNNVIGVNNTALGSFAGNDSTAPNLTNATAIGAYADVTQSDSLVLGGISGLNGCTAASNCASVKVGIGTAAPTNVFTIAQGAGLAIADGWSTYSSRRWKDNVQTLHGALDKVEQLRGVSYDLKSNGKHEVGVIAEEVGAVVPEVVTWDKNGKDAQGVDYGRLTALLIEATKEQQALIADQQKQIKEQQAQIARLASQVETIRATIKASGQANPEVHKAKARALATLNLRQSASASAHAE
jgi:hypothetical protein